MKKAIVATKVGMTQIFNEDGVLPPVTVLQAGPVYVSQIKSSTGSVWRCSREISEQAGKRTLRKSRYRE